MNAEPEACASSLDPALADLDCPPARYVVAVQTSEEGLVARAWCPACTAVLRELLHGDRRLLAVSSLIP